ncbi:MAG: DUF4160 domain-containing protein [Bacteroidales bacterium]|nr:DUF4160 domain-containing protein [Bacteroidales bacterium]
MIENGFRFFFFSNEGNPLEPCHIHVRKHGALAKYWIGERIELAENNGFSAKELKEIEAVIQSNKNQLKEAWNEFFSE